MTPPRLTHHRVAWSTVDDIARGTADLDTVREIRNAERSRSLLLLRAIRDEALSNPAAAGPLPPPDLAWQVLEEVQRTAPAVFEEVLSYPYVAGWAGFTLRHLRRGHSTDPEPAWAHLGHLYGIAAAAGLRAGVDLDLPVPVRRGVVSLPTLGAARVFDGSTDPCSVARIRSSGSSASGVEIEAADLALELPADVTQDGPNWQALRSFAFRQGPHVLSLRLDDLDPYRGLYESLDPHRLDDAEASAWHKLLDGAWQVICRCLPERADTMSAALDVLAPYPFTSRFPLVSASSGEAFGGVVVARPDAPEDLAETLVHEFQHILLGGLLRLVPLLRQDKSASKIEGGFYYAPWRDDPRPAAGLLQGICAFSGVTELWRAASLREGDPVKLRAEFGYSRWQTPTREAVHALRADADLTEAGRRLIGRIGQRLADFETGAQGHHPAASMVAADHRAGWRLRYLRPDPAAVAALAWHWQDASDSGTRYRCGETLGSEPDGPWSSARADLLQRAAQADRFPDIRASVALTGATPADRALAEGRHGEALDGYRDELREDPDRPAAWTGFALAWAALEAGPGPALLMERPQLVRAVHRLLRAGTQTPQPDTLATWLATRLEPGDGPQGSPRTGMA
ncbi:HEXXH motif domain-containing protein [Streptomyces kunmingensis]|uniref:HEXXH motif domain-containing protein n=1 Tax=Streptomyces kunmingensis TaxID=68225 RepID=A0ABU6C2G3_9ACTN|nr:HEXXH motif domain-containing protein [Streptomyces kunmingensis]MEB3958824.1 HEXXH motif domain-containing protein [Streptomyces kunmingensis]